MTAIWRGIILLTIWALVCAPPANSKDTTVMVIPKGTTTSFWHDVQRGAETAARELNVKMVFRGPRNEEQKDAQIKIIEIGIKHGVDAIVLAPYHVHKPLAAVRKAIDRGIKVVIIDSAMEGDDYASFIASDNYKAGQRAAEHLVALIGGSGDVALIRLRGGNASTDAREKGFTDALKPYYPQIQLVADPYAGSYIGTSYRLTMDLLEDHPQIKGIFAVNQVTTTGALRALKATEFAGSVQFVGFDYADEFKIPLARGILHGCIVQQPYMMGYQGVKTAVDALKGVAVPKTVHTDTVLIHAGNLEHPDIQRIINPKNN